MIFDQRVWINIIIQSQQMKVRRFLHFNSRLFSEILEDLSRPLQQIWNFAAMSPPSGCVCLMRISPCRVSVVTETIVCLLAGLLSTPDPAWQIFTNIVTILLPRHHVCSLGRALFKRQKSAKDSGELLVYQHNMKHRRECSQQFLLPCYRNGKTYTTQSSQKLS